MRVATNSKMGRRFSALSDAIRIVAIACVCPRRGSKSGNISQLLVPLVFSVAECRVRDLNPRPSVYKTAALPLC